MDLVIFLMIDLVECAANKAEDVNLNVFTMATRINESKT